MKTPEMFSLPGFDEQYVEALQLQPVEPEANVALEERAVYQIGARTRRRQLQNHVRFRGLVNVSLRVPRTKSQLRQQRRPYEMCGCGQQKLSNTRAV